MGNSGPDGWYSLAITGVIGTVLLLAFAWYMGALTGV